VRTPLARMLPKVVDAGDPGPMSAMAPIAAKFCGAVLDVNLNEEMSYPIADALAVRSVPFVFVTGYDKGRILDGYRVFPVLQKPFHRSELNDILAKLLAPKEPRVESVTAAGAKTSP
jgi:hypothetical protein